MEIDETIVRGWETDSAEEKGMIKIRLNGRTPSLPHSLPVRFTNRYMAADFFLEREGDFLPHSLLASLAHVLEVIFSF